MWFFAVLTSFGNDRFRMVDQQKLTSTINWLVSGAQPPKPLEDIVGECATRLAAGGIPLDALIINGIFLNASIRGIRTIWSKKRGIRRQIMDRNYMDDGYFLTSPQFVCVSTQRIVRYRFDDNDPEMDRKLRDIYLSRDFTDFIIFPLVINLC